MARMLAQHCALASHEQAGGVDRIELVLPLAHRHLLEKAYQDKLQQHLSRELGNDVQLRVDLGAPQNDTPVEIDRQARDQRQAEAVAAIESDPFVRTLIDQFDGRLDEAATWVQAARTDGVADLSMLRGASELAALRNDPRWEDWQAGPVS